MKSVLVVFIPLLISLIGTAVAGEGAAGVGLQVVPTDKGELVVLHVVEDSSAQAVGLRPGDLLIQVDELVLSGSDFEEVARRYLWGESGSEVTLRYLRPGLAGVHRVTLRRQVLKATIDEPAGVRMLRRDVQTPSIQYSPK